MKISLSFFRICALSLLALSTASAQTLLFDFGREAAMSGVGGLTTNTGWNNIYVPGHPASAYTGSNYVAFANTGTGSPTLVTSTGADSPITIGSFVGGDWGVSGAGANATTPLTSPSGIAYPATASTDSFFASVAGTAGFLQFTISGLTVTNTYDFSFYASSGGSGGRSDFQVTGLTIGTGFIDSTGNTNTFVNISGIAPKLDGTIDILLGGKATTGNNSRYNTMEIITVPEPTTAMMLLVGMAVLLLPRWRSLRYRNQHQP